MTHPFRIPALLAAAALMTSPALAGEEGDGWAALSRPGVVVMMRHAIAPGTGDPAAFRLDDCSTQRNLNQAGRMQARAIGDALREAGYRPDRVLSSQWCRCIDTADALNFGDVEEWPALNSFFEDRSTRDAQTAATRARLAALPEDETVVLVTHQVNITALTGIVPASGEMVMVEVDGTGEVDVLGRARVTPGG